MDPLKEGSFDASLRYRSHGLLHVPSDILQIENKMIHPAWDFKGDIPKHWDQSRDYDLRVAEVDRWIQYLQSGRISEDIFYQEVLPVLGVEQDNSGNIILYHATTFDSLLKIIQDSCIKPSSETGNRAWRTEGEVDQSKVEKVYIATNHRIPYIAASISGGSYILQAHVTPLNLRIDEDSHTGEFPYAWAYSLAKGQTCSCIGEIDRFQIYARLANNTDHIENENILELLKKLKLPYHAFENEESQLDTLRKMNIDIDNIQILKNVRNDDGYNWYIRV